MYYMEMITADREWVCPKSGLWKITCVGGGSSGYANSARAGGNTSFGDILSAVGGVTSSTNTVTSIANTLGVGGEGGYTPCTYGGVGQVANASYWGCASTANGGEAGLTGIGYGAGGGAQSESGSIKIKSGSCGELKQCIVDITEGTAIVCAIGKGGVAVDNTTAGNDGVIVVQYLGEVV